MNEVKVFFLQKGTISRLKMSNFIFQPIDFQSRYACILGMSWFSRLARSHVPGCLDCFPNQSEHTFVKPGGEVW